MNFRFGPIFRQHFPSNIKVKMWGTETSKCILAVLLIFHLVRLCHQYREWLSVTGGVSNGFGVLGTRKDPLIQTIHPPRGEPTSVMILGAHRRLSARPGPSTPF